MMRSVGIMMLLAVLAGCAQTASPEARGRAVFVSYDCKRCHRIGQEGGTTGPDLTYAGFRKSRQFLDVWLKDPAAWQPQTLMPNFHFNDPTRKALAAYLATLRGQAFQGTPPWGSEPDSFRRGERIYERVGCATCHGKSGKGGYRNNNVIGGLVPALTKAAEGFTKEELVSRIANGVAHPIKDDPNGAPPLLYMPAWKEVLRPADIEAVADYVLSLAPKSVSKDVW